MTALFFLLSIFLLLAGHLFRLLRWEQFIRIYERPSGKRLLNAMAGGYVINFLLPFHLGDIFRAIFSGKKMRSGTGFGFATVIMDRFLDVWFVTLFFWIFRMAGMSSSDERMSVSYLLLSAVLVLVFVFIVLFRDPLKRLCLSVSGIFNESIKLDVLMFLWSLINTFKDLRRVKFFQLLTNTLLMWGAYLGSYAAIAKCLTYSGAEKNVFDVFTLLFGTNGLARTTFSVAAGMGGGKIRFLIIAWFLLPLALMALFTLFPWKAADRSSPANNSGRLPHYENLLPQMDPNDRSVFLSKYFGLKNKDYLDKFLEINRDISIIQDYSAGSNATTMLCMDQQKTFFRKYAFGADGVKLSEQLAWIRQNEKKLPLCRVIREGNSESCCWYDMEYDPAATDFFRFLHSHPMNTGISVLRNILDTLKEKLYAERKEEDPVQLEKYIDTKIIANLNKIKDSHVLGELTAYESIVVNGTEYRNLSVLDKLFDRSMLLELFGKDPIASVHGDLTIENIICKLDYDNSWYLIDPNPGNVHDTPFLDYAKLMQSVHGSYEFMMMTPICAVNENHIDFQMTRSAAYDAILEELRGYIRSVYGEEAYKSVMMHEVVHWLRLMPYKLAKDKKRAPMFYAGLILAANDAAKELGL